MSDRREMEAARNALYPPPHNPAYVDTIDVARWDAFDAGWKARAVLAEQPREDERLKIALMERDWLLGAWAAACRIPQAEAEAEMLKWSEKWRDAALNAEENPDA